MAGAAGSRAEAGSTTMDFTAVDMTLATVITMAGSTAITMAIDSAGGASSVDFTHIRGGGIIAPIRPATTLT